MFKVFCTFYRVTPYFFKIVFGLGSRNSSLDEDFMTCHCKFTTALDTIENKDIKTKSGFEEKASSETHLESFG